MNEPPAAAACWHIWMLAGEVEDGFVFRRRPACYRSLERAERDRKRLEAVRDDCLGVGVSLSCFSDCPCVCRPPAPPAHVNHKGAF